MFYELALFAGAGGGILGGKINGVKTVCAVEIEKYPCGILMQRQNDGALPAFPIWTNAHTFTKRNNECRQFIRQLQRIRDSLVVTGGFPCQDVSVSGKGAGLDGERSGGGWRSLYRIVCEIRPAIVYMENSPMLTDRGLNVIAGKLSEVGYNLTWGLLGAADVGANHIRKRIWIFAWRNDKFDANGTDKRGGGLRNSGSTEGGEGGTETQFKGGNTNAANHNKVGGQIQNAGQQPTVEIDGCDSTPRSVSGWPGWWAIEPGVLRMDDGIANRLDRIKAIGNAQVPRVAATAWHILSALAGLEIKPTGT